MIKNNRTPILLALQLEGASKEELQDMIQKFDVKSPLTGNDLSSPMEFNLMFDTQIGPSSMIKGFVASILNFVKKIHFLLL